MQTRLLGIEVESRAELTPTLTQLNSSILYDPLPVAFLASAPVFLLKVFVVVEAHQDMIWNACLGIRCLNYAPGWQTAKLLQRILSEMRFITTENRITAGPILDSCWSRSTTTTPGASERPIASLSLITLSRHASPFCVFIM